MIRATLRRILPHPQNSRRRAMVLVLAPVITGGDTPRFTEE